MDQQNNLTRSLSLLLTMSLWCPLGSFSKDLPTAAVSVGYNQASRKPSFSQTYNSRKMKTLVFPDVEVGKIYEIDQKWNPNEKHLDDNMIAAAVNTVSVPADAQLKLRLGYSIVDHPELLERVPKDAFVVVDCNTIDFDDSLCGPLSRLSSVRRLELSACEITDAGVTKLCSLKNLRTIFIDHTDIKGACLKALSELPALEFLWLNNTQLLPQYYSDIAKLSHVKILNLSACDLDDSSLKYVGQMNQLTDLKLSRNTRLSNASLKSLRGLTHLKFLNLDTPKVTLKGLQDLKEMPLREIVISNFAWAKESKEIARTFPHTLVISPESKNTPDVRFLYSPLK